MGGAAAAPVFKAIATEALRMLDVPKDIPDDAVAVKKPVKPTPVEEDVSIAGLSEGSIMQDDPSLRELLAAQAVEDAANVPKTAFPRPLHRDPPSPTSAANRCATSSKWLRPKAFL